MASTAAAQVVTDGDTLKLDGTTYRLWGIDAPETRQLCGDGWAGGVAATETLKRLIVGKTVSCEPRTRDRYGRTVALCRADGVDIGSEMVASGMAWAFTKYSMDYALPEVVAWIRGLGVHGHGCEKPWAWRARNRGDR